MGGDSTELDVKGKRKREGEGGGGGAYLLAVENSLLRPHLDDVKIIVLRLVFLFVARGETITTVFTSSVR